MNTELIKGCDVSAFQGSLDYKLLSDTYKFVIFRNFVGNDSKDKFISSNIQAARDNGMAVGIYNFVFPLPEAKNKFNRCPKEQAQLHFDNTEEGVSLIACDLEWPVPQDWKKWNCNANQIKDWTRSYLTEFQELSGIKPVIYTYPSFAQSLKMEDDFANYDLWIASYTKEPKIPSPWTDWQIWQNSGSARFDGVNIDTNFCKDLSIF
jgi:lysozyme